MQSLETTCWRLRCATESAEAEKPESSRRPLQDKIPLTSFNSRKQTSELISEFQELRRGFSRPVHVQKCCRKGLHERPKSSARAAALLQRGLVARCEATPEAARASPRVHPETPHPTLLGHVEPLKVQALPLQRRSSAPNLFTVLPGAPQASPRAIGLVQPRLGLARRSAVPMIWGGPAITCSRACGAGSARLPHRSFTPESGQGLARST